MSRRILSKAPILSGVTLTAAYTDNKAAMKIEGSDEINLLIDYTPKAAETNRYASVLVEVSADDVASPSSVTNWRVFGVVSETTTEQDLFGNPIVLPGDKTSTGGTKYSRQISLSSLAARWIRISAQEDSGSNNGVISIELTNYGEV